MKDGTRVYLHPAENKPRKTARPQNKRFITMYMLLVAVARPRKIFNRVWIDGKVSIWPTVNALLKRDSKTARREVHETSHVNGERHNKLMIEVTPPIKARRPIPPGQKVFVPQDSAKSQTGRGVMEVIQGVAGDITLKTHPANSPDLDFNDVGFHSIHQLKEDVGVTNGAVLVEATMEAFNVYPWETLGRVYGKVKEKKVIGYEGDMTARTRCLTWERETC
ncbi:unnamed protein product [Discosporangium mesarthrocarpum]